MQTAVRFEQRASYEGANALRVACPQDIIQYFRMCWGWVLFHSI